MRLDELGMIDDMTTVRRTITLPADLDARTRELAPDGNFSAFVTEALAEYVRRRGLDAFIEFDDAEHGPIPEEEVDAIAAEVRKLARELGGI
ncbi:MAG: hypothetical protein QOE86_4234 [Solirubrobacteraceae bacterium]|nr:hypothetical protein [Solirubrobacteraceae bacterium]